MADTHYAASAELADVQGAITAASSGDTVIVPGDTAAIWDGQLIITKGILLLASGGVQMANPPVPTTLITSSYVGTNGSYGESQTAYLVVYAPANPALDEPFRISGFSFDLDHKCDGIQIRTPVSYVEYPLTKVRIDHNKFTNPPESVAGGSHFCIQTQGTIFGLADHNLIYGNGVQTANWSQAAWASANPAISSVSFGSLNFMFYEDNWFYPSHTGTPVLLIYGGNGCKYCFRHNYIDGVGVPNGFSPMFDIHSTQGTASTNLGTIGAEIYENTIVNVVGGRFVQQRGGKAIVYNNPATGGLSTWYIDPTEEHCDYETNGIGGGVYVSGSTGEHFFLHDSYYWLNTRNGNPLSKHAGSSGVVTTKDYDEPVGESGYPEHLNCKVDHSSFGIGVVPERDKYFWAEPDLLDDYEYDGSRGVGYGLLSARPSSGLGIGVGYWATDENKFYRATSATTWEEIYTPSAYPHPLQDEIPKGFSLSIIPTSREVAKGSVAAYVVTVNAGSEFTHDVQLSVDGLPEGTDPTFDTNPLGPNESTDMEIDTADLDVGEFNLVLKGEALIP